MKSDARLSGLETFFYYLAVICSLGFYWILKVVIKKAILDAHNEING